jgi:hypothetical protein
MKASDIKGKLEDINLWQQDDARVLQEHLSVEPDPSSREWVQWSVKKKMLEDALGRLKDRQQLSDKFGQQV